MKRKTAILLGIGFAALVLAVLVFTSTGANPYRCQICLSFNGRTACRVAGAATEAQALRAATENACAQIASGVTDSMACENTPPDSVKWLSRK